MTEFLDSLWNFFREGFLASLVVGAVLPLVGALMLLRRTEFLGVAVPQFSAAGLACAFLALPFFPGVLDYHLDHGHPPMGYLLAFAGTGAAAALGFFAWLEGRDRRGSSGGRLAAGFALATALSVLFLAVAPIGDNYLHTILEGGQILMLDGHGLAVVLAVFLATFAGLARWRRGLLLVAFDPDAATGLGHSVARYELRQAFLVGLAVAGGVMTVGPVLVFGLLFLPPLGARRMAGNLRVFLLTGTLIGLAAALTAWPFAILLDWPYGPATVVVAGFYSALCGLAGRLRDGRTAAASEG